jgi:hypothetical protein
MGRGGIKNWTEISAQGVPPKMKEPADLAARGFSCSNANLRRRLVGNLDAAGLYLLGLGQR